MATYPDPVCGMTVDESGLRAEGYDQFRFCSPGCRTAFVADPGAYGGNDHQHNEHHHHEETDQ